MTKIRFFMILRLVFNYKMIQNNNNHLSEPSGQNTLAHELLARDEQFVGIFFAAFAIQYYLHKDMLSKKLNPPVFLDFFKDIELYASQRVFIKNMVSNKKYKPICEEIQNLLMEYNTNQDRRPYDIFLSRMNKSFLIRQIFKHSDQVLEKYRFIGNFINKDINEIDYRELYEKMWHLPVEQQLLICVCIFSKLHDNFESKKKSIGSSFLENTKRLVEAFETMGKQKSVEFKNLTEFVKYFDK